MPRKKNTVSTNEILNIKNTILEKGTITIVNAVDCSTLAKHIFSITGKYISDSTLKRFFGFNSSSFAPAYQTIQILSEYISIEINKKDSLQATADLISDFFNPIHFEKIDRTDTKLQATCRSMAIHLRNNPRLFEKVMEPIAKSKFGRTFYYELFLDYEYLSAYQYKGYEKYLENEKSYEGKLFGNAALFLKYFFDQNMDQIKIHWQKNAMLYEPQKKLHPFVRGRYFKIELIGSMYFNPSKMNKILDEIFVIEKSIPRNGKGLFREFPGFHFMACDGLWHTKNYKQLFELSTIAIDEFEKTEEFIWKGYYDQLYLYHALGLSMLGEKSEAKKIATSIKPNRFYFPTKAYYEKLFITLKETLS